MAEVATDNKGSPLPVLLPTYGHGLQGPEVFAAALRINDLVSFDRNRLRDPQKHIPRGRVISKQACLQQLIDYTQDRVLFGKPLNHNQAIQLRLADMSRRITAAQSLSFRLGQLKDSGRMKPGHVSVAKWNNIRMALDIARDARDMLGGSGISTEFCPIRHMLNLESVITYEGTETIHQLVVGKELTGVSAF